jgi:hypothetical protein
MSESTRGFKISAAASHKTLQASSQHDPGAVQDQRRIARRGQRGARKVCTGEPAPMQRRCRQISPGEPRARENAVSDGSHPTFRGAGLPTAFPAQVA